MPLERPSQTDPPTDKRAVDAQERQERRDEADLQAQRAMADATEKIVALTALQAAVAVGGLVMLWFTLKLNRDTIRWMIRADRPRLILRSIDTKGFAKVLNAQPDQRQQRFLISILATIKNVGPRTGMLEAVRAHYILGDLPMTPPTVELKAGEWRGSIPIPSDIDFTVPNAIEIVPLSFEEADAVLHHERTLCLYGLIRYSDIHGTVWRSSFAMQYLPPFQEGDEEGVFYNQDPGGYWYDAEEEPEVQRRRGPWSIIHKVLPRLRP